MIKLLLGGSPCTNWSIAKGAGRETKPKGVGWELFRNYLIAKEKYQPDYFLYENNFSMARPICEQITKELGVDPVMINSALVSAQSRKRLYWTDAPIGGRLPVDRKIMLADILESGYVAHREKAYTLRVFTGWNSGNAALRPVRIGTIAGQNSKYDSKPDRVYSTNGKSTTLCGCAGGSGAKTGLYVTPAVGDKHSPVYEVKNGMIGIDGGQYPINLENGKYIVRKLTVNECKRLQTVPDEYDFPVSNTQAYKMLGNGWTVDVIVHLMQFIPGIQNEPVEVLSMYDGMSCGRLALNRIGAHITKYYATEIDKYAIKTTQHNFPDTIQLGDAFQVREYGWRVE